MSGEKIHTVKLMWLILWFRKQNISRKCSFLPSKYNILCVFVPVAEYRITQNTSEDSLGNKDWSLGDVFISCFWGALVIVPSLAIPNLCFSPSVHMSKDCCAPYLKWSDWLCVIRSVGHGVVVDLVLYCRGAGWDENMYEVLNFPFHTICMWW